MSMTNDQLEAAIGELSARLAQLPTKSQIQTLTDLLDGYKTTTDQLIAQLTNKVDALKAENQDLKQRVTDLENA